LGIRSQENRRAVATGSASERQPGAGAAENRVLAKKVLVYAGSPSTALR